MRLSLMLLLNLLFTAHAFARYEEHKVGCLYSVSELMQLECDEEKLSFDVLQTFYKSKRADARKDLKEAILHRARYFINKKQFDYFSVLSLMVFPMEDKEKWLLEFKNIPGKRAPFSIIALERIQGKKAEGCDKKNVPLYLKEICTIPLLK